MLKKVKKHSETAACEQALVVRDCPAGDGYSVRSGFLPSINAI